MRLYRILVPVLALLAGLPGVARAGDEYASSLSNIFPTADPGPSPRAVDPGVPAAFDASGSGDSDGSLASATWDFGDGTIAQGITASHTYARTGAYVAHLTVRDDRGAIGSAPLLVLVGAQPKTITEDVDIPVSGGSTVHARITRPDDGARHPVVMRYSLYCVSSVLSDEALVRSGYVFIAAEAPGVCGSGGTFDLFGPAVGRAGYDTIEWAAAQSWSDGNVGLVGHSGPAITGLAAARTRPPHLRTAVLGSTYADPYRDAVYPGGVLSGVGPEYDAVVVAEPRPGMEPQPRAQGWLDWETGVLGHPTDDELWRARSLAADYAALDIPVYWISSWSDLFTRGALEFFRYRGNPSSRIAMYPGPHWSFDPTGTMGYRAVRDQDVHVGSEERVWLDRYLRGVGGEDPRPRAALFVPRGGGAAAQAFGTGQWMFADQWPLPETQWQRWWMRSDGVLAPVPLAGVDMVLPIAPGDGVTDPRWLDFWSAAGHRAQDGRGYTDAPDGPTGLTFTSDAFPSETTIAGPITLRFTAALAGTDASFHATLSDVWPDGSAHVLTSGSLRASMRAVDDARSWHNAEGEVVRVWHPHDRIEPAAPGEDAEYVVEIWPTADTLAPGHRLRLGLSLTRAPWYAPEPSAAGAVIRGGSASILLPVFP